MMTNQARVAAWLDQDRVRNFILAVIIFNAILLERDFTWIRDVKVSHVHGVALSLCLIGCALPFSSWRSR